MPASTPFSPSATLRTAAPSVTIENVTSEAAATAAGVAADRIPFSTSGAPRSCERFHPVTRCPAASKRGTIT